MLSHVATAKTPTFAPDKTVVYKPDVDPSLELKIFSPPETAPSSKRPVIVFFFGGGWISGSADQFYAHCAYFSSRGLVAISADYRTAESHQTSPRECIEDGKSVIRWIRGHAEELGIDLDRLIAGGGSAGGQVAAATGTVKGFDAEGDDLSISSVPNALVLFNPVYDNGPKGYGNERVGADWEKLSPMNNIDAKTPPTVVFLGTRDGHIPVATAERFKTLMTDAGVRSDLHLHDDRKHGFFNLKKSSEDFAATVGEADRFLASLGYLEGEPTIDAWLADQK